MDDLLLNLVVLEARRVNVTPFWAAEASKQLVIRVRSLKLTDSISPSLAAEEACMNKTFALICLLTSLIIRARRLWACRILDAGTRLHMHECYCYCEADVHSSSVSLVYVVRLRIIFSKAALQKKGSIEPMEPPLDPPLNFITGRGYSPCNQRIGFKGPVQVSSVQHDKFTVGGSTHGGCSRTSKEKPKLHGNLTN